MDFAPGTTGQGAAPQQQGEAVSPSIPADVRITFDPTGQPLSIQQPAAPPAGTDGQAPPNTISEKDFRNFQSAADRRFYEAQQAHRQELAALQAQLATFERDKRLSEARTPLERQQMELRLQEEQLQARQAEMEAAATAAEDQRTLAMWDSHYTDTVGMSPQLVRGMTVLAQQQVQQEIQGGQLAPGDAYARLHELREERSHEFLLARARGEVPPEALNPALLNQQQPANSTPAVQPVARPNYASAGAPSLNALMAQAMRSRSEEDWQRVYQAAGKRH